MRFVRKFGWLVGLLTVALMATLSAGTASARTAPSAASDASNLASPLVAKQKAPDPITAVSMAPTPSSDHKSPVFRVTIPAHTDWGLGYSVPEADVVTYVERRPVHHRKTKLAGGTYRVRGHHQSCGNVAGSYDPTARTSKRKHNAAIWESHDYQNVQRACVTKFRYAVNAHCPRQQPVKEWVVDVYSKRIISVGRFYLHLTNGQDLGFNVKRLSGHHQTGHVDAPRGGLKVDRAHPGRSYGWTQLPRSSAAPIKVVVEGNCIIPEPQS